MSGTTNVDLFRIAQKNNIKLDHVLFKDQLSNITYKANLNIILNMSNSGHPGTHWIALHTTRSTIYFSDPFGVVPPIEVQLWKPRNKVVYNDFILEDLDGRNCGQLALEFLKLCQNTLDQR